MNKNYTIITGGGGFLAYFFAEVILEENKNLFLIDIDKKKLKQNQIKLEKIFKQKIRTDVVDVTNQNSIKKFLNKNKNIFFDNLINNASKDFKVNKSINSTFRDMTKISLKEWNSSIDSNLTSYFLVTKEIGKYMKKKESGNIINIASELSVIAPDNRVYNKGKNIKFYKPVTYSVCKHGVVGLTKYLASSWANYGIRCNSLSPGSVYKDDQDKSFLSEVSKRVPLSRLAYPNELKDAIRFLISSENSFCTGQNIIIDGGRSII